MVELGDSEDGGVVLIRDLVKNKLINVNSSFAIQQLRMNPRRLKYIHCACA